MEGTIKRMTAHDMDVLRGRRGAGKTILYISVGFAALGALIVSFLFDIFVAAIAGGVVVAASGMFAYWLCNRKIIHDLNVGEKIVVVKPIDSFDCNTKQESADHKGMSPEGYYRWSQFVTGWTLKSGNLRYRIGQKTYEMIQDQKECEFHYAPTSLELLGIYPIGYSRLDDFDPEEATMII